MDDPYRPWQVPIGAEHGCYTNISNSHMNLGKKFIQFFQDKSFGQKKAPAGSRRAKKKQLFEKHKQGPYKNGV